MKSLKIQYTPLRAAVEFTSADRSRFDLTHVYVRILPQTAQVQIFATDGRTLFADCAPLVDAVGFSSEEVLLFPSSIVKAIRKPKSHEHALECSVGAGFCDVTQPGTGGMSLRFPIKTPERAQWIATFFAVFPAAGVPVACLTHHINPVYTARLARCRKLFGDGVSAGVQLARVPASAEQSAAAAPFVVRFPGYESAVVLIMPVSDSMALDGYPSWMAASLKREAREEAARS